MIVSSLSQNDKNYNMANMMMSLLCRKYNMTSVEIKVTTHSIAVLSFTTTKNEID